MKTIAGLDSSLRARLERAFAQQARGAEHAAARNFDAAARFERARSRLAAFEASARGAESLAIVRRRLLLVAQEHDAQARVCELVRAYLAGAATTSSLLRALQVLDRASAARCAP